MTPAQDDVPTMEKMPCQKVFLDDFDISEALLKSLQGSKKMEEFVLLVSSDKYFYRGDDFRKIKKVVENVQKAMPIRFEVRTYFFSSGENCYTMDEEEKIQYCELKKPKIAALIEEGEYEKALTLLDCVREMSEKVDHHQKEKQEIAESLKVMLPYRKSSLLNTTLCQWKLGRWSDLVKTAELILSDIDTDNAKALYRLCLAYLKKKDYEKVIQRCSAFWSRTPDASKHYPELNNLYTRCQNLEANIKNKERNMYKGMLQNL